MGSLWSPFSCQKLLKRDEEEGLRNRLGRVIAVTRVFNNTGQYGFRTTVNSLNPKKKGTKETDLGGRIHGSYHSWRSTGMTTIRNKEMCVRMF